MNDRPLHPSGRPVRREVVRPLIERNGRRVWPVVERLADDKPERAGGMGFLLSRSEAEWDHTVMKKRS